MYIMWMTSTMKQNTINRTVEVSTTNSGMPRPLQRTCLTMLPDLMGAKAIIFWMEAKHKGQGRASAHPLHGP